MVIVAFEACNFSGLKTKNLLRTEISELKILNFGAICQSLTGSIVWAVGVWYCFRRACSYRKSNYVDNTSKGSKSVDNKKNDYDRGSAQYMPPDE